ncbi:Transposase DDE domain-containing protein [Acinetobacter bereziniae]|uniref:Transposase DDE domain-containing protein n=1 Tax=Acinetobacter bereziniae NIPH 3 TaxID=1217651 RepID=N8XEL0_ACIBZ|nr:hypothetical protein F963_01365 [Acinetobacter bereziniae NIPH 3]ENV22751.1 hypothetical protein F963_01367 [Acinetobacter bereziniae NIPH 3]
MILIKTTLSVVRQICKNLTEYRIRKNIQIFILVMLILKHIQHKLTLLNA